MTEHPLDNPVYASLTGPHRHFARRLEHLRATPQRWQSFAGFAEPPTSTTGQTWPRSPRPTALLSLTGVIDDPPPDWQIVDRIAGVQLVDDGVATAPDDEAVRLGPPTYPR